jgi:hypothetical protein
LEIKNLVLFLLTFYAAATNEESTNNEEDEAIDKNFCSCGHCALLPKQRECLCCKQFQHYDEHYRIATATSQTAVKSGKLLIREIN